MQNQTTIMYKLQKALLCVGYVVTIMTYQIYLQEEKKMVRIYVLKHGEEQVMKTSSQIKLIKYMGDCYKEIGKNPEVLNMDVKEQNDYMDIRCRKW